MLFHLSMLLSQFWFSSSFLGIQQSKEKSGPLELSDKQQAQDAQHRLFPFAGCVVGVSQSGDEGACQMDQNLQCALKAGSETVGVREILWNDFG